MLIEIDADVFVWIEGWRVFTCDYFSNYNNLTTKMLGVSTQVVPQSCTCWTLVLTQHNTCSVNLNIVTKTYSVMTLDYVLLLPSVYVSSRHKQLTLTKTADILITDTLRILVRVKQHDYWLKTRNVSIGHGVPLLVPT